MTPRLKRVTLWVRDASRSLAFYRDALGLEVLEDKALSGPAIARLVGLDQATLRILHLGPRGATHGWVGLYEIRDTAPRPMESLTAPDRFPLYGQSAIVFDVTDVLPIHARLKALVDVRVVSGPTSYEKLEASEAMPAGRYSELIVQDPDGFVVSLMGYQALPRRASVP